MQFLKKIEKLVKASKIVRDIIMAYRLKNYDDIIVTEWYKGKYCVGYKSIDTFNLSPKTVTFYCAEKIDKDRMYELLKNNLDHAVIPLALGIINYIVDEIGKDLEELSKIY